MTPAYLKLLEAIVLSANDLVESVEEFDGMLVVDEVKLDCVYRDLAALYILDDFRD